MNDVQLKLDQYKDIFSQLKRKLKWKMVDDRTLMMVAATYVVNNHAFDLKRFINLSEHIKDEVGVFSTLKSNQRFTTAAMLDVRFAEPKGNFPRMIGLYDQLVVTGFGRGAFTYIAALVLLSEEMDQKMVIEKAHVIYKAMKKEHFFLTSNSDYPLAALLATVEGEIDQLIQGIENYYRFSERKSPRRSKTVFRRGMEVRPNTECH